MNAPAVSVSQRTDLIQQTAIRAALAAGRVQLESRREVLAVDRLLDHDIKLEVDRLSEEAVLLEIRTRFPDATIYTEEGGILEGSSELVWIVDPLDGTMNYFHGSHHFCCCVACYRNPDPAKTGLARLGMPVIGVVYAPSTDELFLGIAGKGATFNGVPLRVSPVERLSEAIVTTSYGSQEPVMQRMERIMPRLVRATRKVRIQGACGLDTAGVGAGRLSGLVQRNIRCWDFAGARIIVEEAGGCFYAEEYAPERWEIVACAPGIEEELMALVTETKEEDSA